ncbi:DUF1173 family protein [Comamonas thiooxydans]|nr:DUF1173 family protein [Comamonas thiooxydans]
MSVMVLLDAEYVDARLVKEMPHLFQMQLKNAKQLGRAKCYCNPMQPLDMVVRQLQGGRVLASWPGTVEQHAEGCPFHGSRIQGYQELSSCRPRDLYKEACFCYREGWMFGAKRTRVQGAVSKVDIDLSWLLSELWQSSLLSSWHKGWTRDWSFIKKRLMRAADELQVNGEGLTTYLHVVETFAQSKRESINKEWDKFLAPLAAAPFNLGGRAGGEPFQTALVLGELNCIRLVQGTWVLTLRNHSAEFGLVPEAAAAIDSRLTSKLQQLSFGGQFKPVVLMCVAMDDLGLIHVLDLTVMEVASRWLPASLRIEKELVSRLVQDGFEFHLTKGHKWGAGIPLLICRNGSNRPWVAVYSYATTMSPLKLQQYQTKMASEAVNIRRKCAFVGYDHPIQELISGL